MGANLSSLHSEVSKENLAKNVQRVQTEMSSQYNGVIGFIIHPPTINTVISVD